MIACPTSRNWYFPQVCCREGKSLEIVSHICIPFLLHFTPAYLGVRRGGVRLGTVLLFGRGRRGGGEGGGGASETSKLMCSCLGSFHGC